MATFSSDQKTFKNTFAPDCLQDELTTSMIIAGLRSTILHMDDLPEEAREAVSAELKRQSSR